MALPCTFRERDTPPPPARPAPGTFWGEGGRSAVVLRGHFWGEKEEGRGRAPPALLGGKIGGAQSNLAQDAPVNGTGH